MIEKSVRTITEKTTSIDYPIEKSQKGIVAVGHKHSGKVAFIPTMIEDPREVVITPLNAAAMRVFARWYCDLVLYGATNASIATIAKSGATAAVNASGDGHILVLTNGKLYVSRPGISASAGAFIASNSLVASNALFQKVDWYASNAKRFLKIGTISSTATCRYIKYSYEVKGY